MKGVFLKLYLVSFLLLLFSFAGLAQNFRFIYLQTENQKSFYVKMGGQSVHLASSGYIIIPSLSEGSYSITIGFPQSTLPELLLSVVLNEADAGYLIKNDVDQGLYVVDLQTMKFVATERQWPVAKSRSVVKSNDGFARILAEVVNDSSINEIPILTKYETPPKVDEIKTVITEPVRSETDIRPTTEIAVAENVATISKLEQRNTSEGLLITYLDNADTVKVFMPVSKVIIPVAREETKDTLIVTKKETEPGKDVRFIDMELQNPNQQADSGALKKDDFVITEKKNLAAISSEMNQKDSIVRLKRDAACKKTATQTDFLNLRKKMAAEKTEAAMRMLAGKQFVSICFNTDQIKNLGVLFTTEEERYKFYVAAYPYVSDVANFRKLGSQLADIYYISRFKAMVQH